MGERLVERQVAVHGLGDIERGLDRQRDADRHPCSAQPDHRTGESLVTAIQPEQAAVGDDELDRPHGRGEGAVAEPGPVSGGGDRSGDGDVGERREVVERQALGVQQRRQLAVPDAALDGDRPGRTVDRHDTVEGGHRDHVAVGVGDMAEAVPAAGGMHAPTVGSALQ